MAVPDRNYKLQKAITITKFTFTHPYNSVLAECNFFFSFYVHFSDHFAGCWTLLPGAAAH